MPAAHARILRFAIAVAATLAAVAALLISGRSPTFATPANDDFPGTAITAVPFQQTIDTTGASLQNDEPSPDCLAFENTVWWSFASSETAIYVLDVKDIGGFVPGVVVWASSTFPGGGLAEQACANYSADEGNGPHTTVAFQGTANKTYYFQIGGVAFGLGGPPNGTADVLLTKTNPPVNDDIANAIHFDHLPAAVHLDVSGATTEVSEPIPGCLMQTEFHVKVIGSAWYQLTPDRSGVVVVDTQNVLGVGAVPVIPGIAAVAAWTGSPGNLSLVACGSPAGFHVTAGETYYIEVANLSIDGIGYVGNGPGLVNLTIEALDVPDCTGAQQDFFDPANDVIQQFPFPSTGPPLADVIGLRVTTNRDWVCLTYQFAHALVPGAVNYEDVVNLNIGIDADSNANTGSPINYQDPCGSPDIGEEASIFASNALSLATQIYNATDLGLSPTLDGYAIQMSTTDSITVAVPTRIVGHDLAFNVFTEATDQRYNVDCIPNSGVMVVTAPTKSAFGDVDCDGQVNGLDVVLILRSVIGLTQSPLLRCPSVGSTLPGSYPSSAASFTSGDANCDKTLTALDALLVALAAADVPAPGVPNCPSVGELPG
jgi:hypothetical protein